MEFGSGAYTRQSAEALHAFYAADGVPPCGIFVNSITALEGITSTLSEIGGDLLTSPMIGCNDWDPFGSTLPLRIVMARQNIERLIDESFGLLDQYKPGRYPRVTVMPEFPSLRVMN